MRQELEALAKRGGRDGQRLRELEEELQRRSETDVYQDLRRVEGERNALLVRMGDACATHRPRCSWEVS